MKLTGILFFLFCFQQVLGQTTVSEIEGYVLNLESNEPIPYVKIYNKSTKNGTISNSDGYFRLQIQSAEDTVIATQIGYKKTIFNLRSDQKFYTLYLTENIQELGEVIARPKDNSYLFDLINKCKKNAANSRIEAKAYYELKSFTDSAQVELVEGFYNIGIHGYNIEDLELKAGRLALRPYHNRVFVSRESSRAITMLQLSNSNSYFPSSPFDLDKKEAKKRFFLSLDHKYLDEFNDSIYILDYKPKNASGYSFEGKIWLNITDFTIGKVTLNCSNCKVHPFLALTLDSISNVSLAITKSFTSVDGKAVFNHIDFSYAVDYISYDDLNRASFYTYSVSTNAVVYAYDFKQTFLLPKFSFQQNVDDYRKLNAFPYNSFFWDTHDEYSTNDAENTNELFYSDPESITNMTLFVPKNLTNITPDSLVQYTGGNKYGRRGVFEHPYIHWSGNRILLREMVADSTTAERLGDIKSRQYNLDVKIFSDFNQYNDSSNILTATIIDPYTTYYYLPMDVYANCFINMYFDLCEIERRKLEKDLTIAHIGAEQYEAIYKRFNLALEKRQDLFLKEVDRGTNRRAMERWNTLIKEQLGIDNIALFKLFEEPEE